MEDEMKTYKCTVVFRYYQVIEVEAATREDAEDMICDKLDRARAVEGEVEIYDLEELTTTS
jgi:hypothetical protein